VLKAGAVDRVDEYTASGRFVWTIGDHINDTTSSKVCTGTEIRLHHAKCQGGAPAGERGREHGAFNFTPLRGDLLAVGGPKDLLYCGDQHRIQEFTSNGRWVREVSLLRFSSAPHSAVAAIAVTDSGDIYVVYHVAKDNADAEHTSDVVRELAPNGAQVASFTALPRDADATVELLGLALDSVGELAVVGLEIDERLLRRIGALFSTRTGRLITEFPLTADNDGSLAFRGENELYIAATDEQELLILKRMPVPELATSPVPCNEHNENQASVRYDCAFAGELDPYSPL